MKKKPTYKQLLEFVRDLVDEPFRLDDEDEREKTLYEASALLKGEL